MPSSSRANAFELCGNINHLLHVNVFFMTKILLFKHYCSTVFFYLALPALPLKASYHTLGAVSHKMCIYNAKRCYR